MHVGTNKIATTYQTVVKLRGSAGHVLAFCVLWGKTIYFQTEPTARAGSLYFSLIWRGRHIEHYVSLVLYWFLSWLHIYVELQGGPSSWW